MNTFFFGAVGETIQIILTLRMGGNLHPIMGDVTIR